MFKLIPKHVQWLILFIVETTVFLQLSCLICNVLNYLYHLCAKLGIIFVNETWLNNLFVFQNNFILSFV